MNRETLLLFALALLVGGLGAIHVPINGSLGVRLGSSLVATLTFYSVALTAIVALNLLFFDRSAFVKLSTVPVWTWLVPGLISVAVVGANTFLIPKLGAVNVFVVAIGAQVVVRTVLSHFGLLNSPIDPVTAPRLLGALLVFIGAVLVVRG